MKLQPVILSGGAGTRLWPLSREHYPKQLLPLVGKDTLLQQTATRLDGVARVQAALALNPSIVVCNVEHRFLIAEQLRTISKKPQAIILESIGRNTAPALTLAALNTLASGEDAVMMVMAADHAITNEAAFHAAVADAYPLARDGMLVTFGIVPTAAETGYGYIRRGQARAGTKVFDLGAFVEKPDAATAQRYVESGEYLWNSGMFMLRASVWMTAIERFRPKIAAACKAATEKGRVDLDFFRVDAKEFGACESDSIDYAVMEPLAAQSTPVTGVAGIAVIPLNAGWSDIGAWSSLLDVRTRDAQGNAIDGDVFAQNCKNSLLSSHSRLLACLGLSDMIVVETSDAVMVAHRDQSQEVKKIVEWLKKNKRPESHSHQRVYRPWGSYESVVEGPRFQVKRIVVNPAAQLSLQMHHHRAEHWIVVTGTARVTRGDEVFLLGENQSTYIPLGVTHRLENPGMVPLEIIEVQSGSYLGEDDIVRFEDQYGRGAPAARK